MIIVKTRLADGIYRSSGGGQIVHHYQFATNGRNLLKAIKILFEHRSAMVRNFGNIGAGSSWIEIDGFHVDEYELTDLQNIDSVWFPSRPARASELIRRVQRQEEIA